MTPQETAFRPAIRQEVPKHALQTVRRTVRPPHHHRRPRSFPGQARAATWTQVSNTVDVSCAAFTYHPAADWFLPAGTPKGLVYLQHGFSRSNGNLADLAEHYAAAGFAVFAPTLPSADIFGCTVSNLGNNAPFLNNVATWLGQADNANGALARSYANALSKAGRAAAALPTSYVIAGHSAGGEVAAYVANRLRTTYPGQFARVRLVQLLDPVKSFIGSNMATGLNGLNLTSTPIFAISSPPYTANSNANGTVELTTDVHRPFLGVRLTTGSHCDAEGASTTGCARSSTVRPSRATSPHCRPSRLPGPTMRSAARPAPRTTPAARTTSHC